MWLCAWNWLDCVSIHTICLCVCSVCVRIQQDPIIMCRVRCIDIPAQNKITFQMNLLTMIPLKCKFAVYPGNSVIRRTTKTVQFRAFIHFFIYMVANWSKQLNVITHTNCRSSLLFMQARGEIGLNLISIQENGVHWKAGINKSTLYSNTHIHIGNQKELWNDNITEQIYAYSVCRCAFDKWIVLLLFIRFLYSYARCWMVNFGSWLLINASTF